jgi:hypothetical protein
MLFLFCLVYHSSGQARMLSPKTLHIHTGDLTSDRMQELLVQGLASLKTGRSADEREARHCLELVLDAEDAEPLQKAKAWLYISRIEKEPSRLRICFESTLTLDPGNPESHQGLAILDGRLKAEDIVSSDGMRQSATREAESSDSEMQRLVCPSCGATLKMKTGKCLPKCVYCGSLLSVSLVFLLSRRDSGRRPVR